MPISSWITQDKGGQVLISPLKHNPYPNPRAKDFLNQISTTYKQTSATATIRMYIIVTGTIHPGQYGALTVSRFWKKQSFSFTNHVFIQTHQQIDKKRISTLTYSSISYGYLLYKPTPSPSIFLAYLTHPCLKATKKASHFWCHLTE